MDRADTDNIRTLYSVSNKVDTLLVFHEDMHTPVASVAMTDLPYPTMKDIIEGNKFLVLPRLSSQVLLDLQSNALTGQRLCEILLIRCKG